jgi:hypothetical protein
MFQGLINNAKSAVSSLVLKYLARASVAVPFLIALGFALAATTVMLVDRFGHITAYWVVAGGLALVGAMAAVIVFAREHEEEIAEQVAEKTDTEEVVGNAAAQAIVQTPIALLGALFTSSPATAIGGVRLLARNLPLVLLLVMIGSLFWPTQPEEDSQATDQGLKPNGADEMSTIRH